MKKKEQSKREIQEDIVLNKVLWWIVGTVVVEFFVLMLNRFYVNYRVAEIDFAVALRPVFHVLTYVLPLCFVVLLIAWLALRRKGKGSKPLAVLTVVALLLAICVSVTWLFGAPGVKFLYIAVPAVGVLALVYYLYQHEFFLVAVLSALGLLGVWVLPHDSGTLVKACVMLAVIVVVLAAAARICPDAPEQAGLPDGEGPRGAALPQECQLCPPLSHLHHCGGGGNPGLCAGRPGLPLRGAGGLAADYGGVLHRAHDVITRRAKAAGPFGSAAFSLLKKPRRVRPQGARRIRKAAQPPTAAQAPADAKKVSFCFFRRHVRRKKHFSARECGICPLTLDKLCAWRAASFSEKRLLPLFREPQATRYLRVSRLAKVRCSPVEMASFTSLWQQAS